MTRVPLPVETRVCVCVRRLSRRLRGATGPIRASPGRAGPAGGSRAGWWEAGCRFPSAPAVRLLLPPDARITSKLRDFPVAQGQDFLHDRSYEDCGRDGAKGF